MADWTTIPDNVLEPGDPVRSVDALAFRDNPIAIAEGAAGAPRVVRAGLAVDARPWELLSSGSVATAASLDITGLTSTHKAFLFLFRELQPATDRSTPLLRLSNDNGVSFLSGASDYTRNLWGRNDARSNDTILARGQADSSIHFNVIGGHEYSNAAGRRGSGQILLYDPTNAGERTRVEIVNSFTGTDGGTVEYAAFQAFGDRAADEANDAFRILFDSGNISTMEWTLFGIRGSN